MALALASLSSAYVPAAALRSAAAARASCATMETVADLEALATKCNPSIGFWDPIGLASATNLEEEQFIGWLRHSEIKHGRVAMAAFVGFCVQSNGIHFPWALTTSGVTYADISAAGGPAAQWDALPTASKLSLLGGIAFLEFWGENSKVLELNGRTHYMKGGKPGYYPTFKASPELLPHPVPLNLWDPFGFTGKMTPERKEKALVAEINNGRLAMIGIMGFMAASKGLIVPGLDSVGVAPYAGEIMAPFTTADASLPFVADMLKWTAPY